MAEPTKHKNIITIVVGSLPMGTGVCEGMDLEKGEGEEI
jgi:hypothetical protein